MTNERAFYRRLLELGNQVELEPLLDQALALIVEVTGAGTAYLELHDDGDGEPRYWRGHRCSEHDLHTIRASISRGVIARALSEGHTVDSPSAQSDPRFEDLRSVQRHEIGAVLCTPIGTPPIGVVYLQDRATPGPFDPVDREHAEWFARQLAPLADRLLARRPERNSVDHTREIRTRFRCAELMGRSASLARVLHTASLVAPLDIDVLITGPVGTGKSALARAIANNGNERRAKGPFVALNCAAIPEPLMESELFGAERGAHSTANRKIIGKVAAAEGGTLFLDEIAELAASAQAKLLHLIQTREYHPLGSSVAVRADIRVISATNANLRARVTDHRFREDLYYRVHILPLEMPGLADRRDDIPELVEYFCAAACKQHHLAALAVSRRAVEACQEADWPGHIRQLQHAVEAGIIRAHGERAQTLYEHHIFPAAPRTSAGPESPLSFQEGTRRFQRRFLREALARNDWNVAKTARELDLARGYVYNLIQLFGLARADDN